MKTVTSKDGTTIAFDQLGNGPALILVGGAFEQRAMDSETAQLAAFPLLVQHFTVFHYDRRGRGDSTDTQPYAVAREIEDIDALINEAGGSTFISGVSSGAILAMEATITLNNKIRKLAMYEPPYTGDPATRQALETFRKQFQKALAEDRRGDAVGHFLTLMGMPAEMLDGMRQLPMWPMWEAIAPTFGYEAALIGEDGIVPTERATQIAVPTLIMDGELTPYPFIQVATVALAQVIPNAQHQRLSGQTHEVTAKALAPVLVEFFAP